MKDYDEIAEQIKKNTTRKEKRTSIFEPHFELIVELSKRGIRKTDILDYIKSIDQSIASKNSRTVQSLFSQYINRQRIQKLISTNIFISEAVITSNLKEKKSKKKSENKHNSNPDGRQNSKSKEEETPKPKQEMQSSNERKNNVEELLKKPMELLTQEERKIVAKHKLAGLTERVENYPANKKKASE